MGTMKTKRDYDELQKALQAEERRTGAYLADTCIDRENVLVDGITERSADFWDRMYQAAVQAAEDRRNG